MLVGMTLKKRLMLPAAAAALVLSGGGTAAVAASGWMSAGVAGVNGPVSAFSDADAWALGTSGFAHWNGAGWRQVGGPAGVGVVAAVADDGAGDAWAVGKVVSGYRVSSPQIGHWDGGSWSISPSPAISARRAGLSGVAAPSVNAAWAVGTDGQHALLERWDGAVWSRVSVPDPNAGTVYGSALTAVTARSTSDVWAIGTFQNPAPAPDSLYALHFDGMSWHVDAMRQTTSQTNSNSPVATGAVALAANDVWMVGYQANFGSPITLTEHWNGTAWAIVASPFDHIPPSSHSISDGSLIAVTARSSTDVWAAGSYFTFTDGDPSGVYRALLIHWNGTTWTQDSAPTSGTYNAIQGIAATPHRIWATNAGTPSLLTHP